MNVRTRVLVIEDEPVILAVLTDILAHAFPEGAHIVNEETTKDGLAHLMTDRAFALVITDGMPTGAAVAAFCNSARIPCILYSGFEYKVFVDDLEEHGIRDTARFGEERYLKKPSSPEQFRHKFSALLPPKL